MEAAIHGLITMSLRLVRDRVLNATEHGYH